MPLIAVVFSWLYLQWTHEGGHVIGAIVSGGGVERVVLHPVAISRTDVSPNPAPLFVAWSGPVGGAVIGPVAAVGLVPAIGWGLWRLVSAFVLLANGVYIGAGVVYPVGDARDLIDLGAPVWLLGVFGGAATAGGVGIVVAGGCDANGDQPSRSEHPKLAGVKLIALAAVLGVIGAVWFG